MKITPNIKFLLVVIIILVGCGARQTLEQSRLEKISHLRYGLPTASKNIVLLGNNWYSFELNGKKFMGRSHHHRQTITQITE